MKSNYVDIIEDYNNLTIRKIDNMSIMNILYGDNVSIMKPLLFIILCYW